MIGYLSAWFARLAGALEAEFGSSVNSQPSIALNQFNRAESEAIARRRRSRQRVIVAALVIFIVLVYAITIVKLAKG